MNSVISIRDLVIKYGQYTVIENFNLEVNRGEIVTLFGPSGCGKSTIIKAILGMISPASGEIKINGTPALKYGLPLAYAPQLNELLSWKTVLENVELWHDQSKEKIQTPYSMSPISAIEHVELEDAISKLPKELSGGMERRTALARSLATNSDIILFDEAFVSVERRLRRKLMHALRQHIKEKDITAIIISHDFEEATYMSDRVVVLTANPTVIDKEIQVNLPSSRDVLLFDKQEFTDQTIRIIH